MFERSDFTKMADQLARIKGRFVLSLNDVPEVRAIFAAFDVRQVSTHYTVQSTGAAPRSELLITNC